LVASPKHLRRWGLACGLALIAACSGANAINTGPFSGGGANGDKNALCTTVAPGGLLSYGLDSFANSGDTATIERIALTGPHNLQLLAAYAVPLTGDDLYGVLGGAPPARHLPAGVEWARRQRADGAVLPGGAQTNLVLVLKPVGAKGTARSVDVFYRSAGQQYHFRTNTSIEVLVANSCPS
jgi:hypothetical protein